MTAALGLAIALLATCDARAAMAQLQFPVLDPKGQIGAHEKWIILLSTGLMLIVVVPGSVMNSFFIPQLGSRIYTMTGMETKLSLLADEPGHYLGLSANYSGGGFSDMTFDAHAMQPEAFYAWVAKVRGSDNALTVAEYRRLEKPSKKVPAMYFSSVGRFYLSRRAQPLHRWQRLH